MKKIGIIGSGIVGQTLAAGFTRHGYSVMIGTRNTAKLKDWQATNSQVQLGSFADAGAFGDMLVLCTKGAAASEALELAGKANLSGKIVMDTTNPIAAVPPEHGVLKFFTDLNGSLMEKLQGQFPEAHFVKTFSSVGSASMIDPDFGGQKPGMFICGNSEEAKAEVKALLEKIGWEHEDMGRAEAARAIEPLCILWCIPGMLHNQWSHAFKLLKK